MVTVSKENHYFFSVAQLNRRTVNTSPFSFYSFFWKMVYSHILLILKPEK